MGSALQTSTRCRSQLISCSCVVSLSQSAALLVIALYSPPASWRWSSSAMRSATSGTIYEVRSFSSRLVITSSRISAAIGKSGNVLCIMTLLTNETSAATGSPRTLPASTATHVFHVKRRGTQAGRRSPSILRVDRRPCPQWIVIAKVHTKVNGSCERQQHRDPAREHLSPILRRHACIAEPQFCPALTIRSQRKGSDASAEVAHG